MATHKIHLAVAKKINEQLNMDLDSIMIGSVLPDICTNKDHTKPHFQNGKPGIEGLSNPDLFVKEYRKELNNPLMMGYLLHLLTDRFYNKYVFENFYIYDKDGNEIGIHLKHKDFYSSGDEIKEIKHREFGLFDYWLINHNFIPKFNSTSCINNIKDIKEASFDKEKNKNYIYGSNKDVDKINLLKRFHSNFVTYKFTTRKNMEKIFYDCCNYIMKYIDDNNLRR